MLSRLKIELNYILKEVSSMRWMFKAMDKILFLLKYEFLNIFMFYFWVFMAGEAIFYSIEKLSGLPNVVMWYDLTWLLVVYILTFFTSFRLYRLMIIAKIEDEED